MTKSRRWQDGYWFCPVISIILRSGLAQALGDFGAQVCRGQHFSMRAVLENVHDEFGIVAVGDLEDVAPFLIVVVALFGMPGFGCRPVGLSRGEAQGGPAHVAPGIDAVSGGQHGEKFLVRDFPGSCFEHFGAAQRIDGEGANGLAGMAPGIEISVFPVADDPLRRNFPFMLGTQRAVAM